MILTKEEFIKQNGLEADHKSDDLDKVTGVFNKYNEYFIGEVNKIKEDKANKAELSNLKEKYFDEKFAQIDRVAKLQQVELAKVLSTTTAKEPTLTGQVKELLKDGAHSAYKALSSPSENGKDSGVFLKAAAGMSLGTNFINGATVPLQYESGYSRVVRRQPFVMDLVSRGTATSNIITWYEQANLDGGAAPTAEGAVKPLFDFDIDQKQETIKKIAVRANVTMELLDDAPQFETFLRNELFRDLRLAVDAQLINGNGTGQNLNGLFTMASTYNAGAFAGTVDNADNWDVIITAIDQIEIAEFTPSDTLMYPSDVTALQLVKGSDGHPIVDRQLAAQQMSIGGVPITKNTGITLDNFLVGDLSRPIIYEKGGIFLRVGLNGNDFSENKVTLVAEWRGLQKITTNDVPALVKGDFTTAIAALETP